MEPLAAAIVGAQPPTIGLPWYRRPVRSADGPVRAIAWLPSAPANAISSTHCSRYASSGRWALCNLVKLRFVETGTRSRSIALGADAPVFCSFRDPSMSIPSGGRKDAKLHPASGGDRPASKDNLMQKIFSRRIASKWSQGFAHSKAVYPPDLTSDREWRRCGFSFSFSPMAMGGNRGRRGRRTADGDGISQD